MGADTDEPAADEVRADYSRADAETYNSTEYEEALAALRPGDHIEVAVSWLTRPTGGQEDDTFHAAVDGWEDNKLTLTAKESGLSAPPVSGDWSLNSTEARTSASDAAFDVTKLWRWPADPAPLDHPSPTILTLDGVAYDRLRALAALAIDVTLEYDGRQLYSEVLAPANTAQLATSIPVLEGPPDSFDIHVDVEVLAGALEQVGQEDSYAFVVDDGDRFVGVRHGLTASTAPVVDEREVDTIGEWPGPFEGAQTTTLNAHELYGALVGAARAAMTAGERNVEIATTESGFTIGVEGTAAEWTIPADVQPGDHSRFDANTLHDAARGLPALGTVAVQVGDDYPLALSYEDFAFLMAPSVTTGGDD